MSQQGVGRVSSLLEVPGLEDLATVCEQQRVSLTCHGGTTRRIAVRAAQDTSGHSWTIFDCVPFSADLDLIHSGSPDQTARVLDDIHRIVPFAEHVRWEVRSQQEQERFNQAKTHAAIVPANLIELGTHSGWNDPWDGLRDLRSRSLRFIRNGFYRNSPEYLAGRDVELLGALLYYKAVLEVPEAIPESTGLAQAREVIAYAAADVATAERLQNSSYLRARFRYVLSSLKSALPFETPMPQWIDESGLHYLESVVTDLGGEAQFREILDWTTERGHLAIASRLGGDRFRVRSVDSRPWEVGDSAHDSFYKAVFGLGGEQPLRLADGQRVTMASPAIECAPGTAPSSQLSEFLHFCLRAPDITGESTDLGGLCVVTRPNEKRIVASVPTECDRPVSSGGAMLRVRCNLGRALTTRTDEEGCALQLFLTEWIARDAYLGTLS